jgi:putative ABC transport system substrate-binding protein
MPYSPDRRRFLADMVWLTAALPSVNWFHGMARLPAVYQSLFFVESGGLMAWAPDQREQYRSGARMADQILKGRRPGDIPVQHPEPYQLHLNKRAAAAMNLRLPADLVAEADKVLS